MENNQKQSTMDAFLGAIEQGIDIETAAYLTGQAPSAIFRLLERGKNEQDRINATDRAVKPKASEAGALDLWVKVAKMRAMSIYRHVNVLNKSAENDLDWKASKYALEHIHPAVYGSMGSNSEVEASRLGQIESM